MSAARSEWRFRPGDVINGRYKIVKRLGYGGTAEVYKVEDGRLRTHVVLKVVHQHHVDHPDALEAMTASIEREACLGAQLRNEAGKPGVEGIVSVFDWGVTESTKKAPQRLPFLVMELLQGRTLFSRIKRVRDERKQFPIAYVLRVALEIVKVLLLLHENGYIHCDLKPENIFLHRGTGRAVLKLMDLGLMVSVKEELTLAVFRGTPRYAAPEQFLLQGLRFGTDTYALGMILYEMLAGRGPFDPATGWRTEEELAEAHVHTPVPSIRQVRPDLLVEVDALVLTMLRKELSPTDARRPSLLEIEKQIYKLLGTIGLEDDDTAEHAEDAAPNATSQHKGARVAPDAPGITAGRAAESGGASGGARSMQMFSSGPPPAAPPLGAAGADALGTASPLDGASLETGRAPVEAAEPARAPSPLVVGDGVTSEGAITVAPPRRMARLIEERRSAILVVGDGASAPETVTIVPVVGVRGASQPPEEAAGKAHVGHTAVAEPVVLASASEADLVSKSVAASKGSPPPPSVLSVMDAAPPDLPPLGAEVASEVQAAPKLPRATIRGLAPPPTVGLALASGGAGRGSTVQRAEHAAPSAVSGLSERSLAGASAPLPAVRPAPPGAGSVAPSESARSPMPPPDKGPKRWGRSPWARSHDVRGPRFPPSAELHLPPSRLPPPAVMAPSLQAVVTPSRAPALARPERRRQVVAALGWAALTVVTLDLGLAGMRIGQSIWARPHEQAAEMALPSAMTSAIAQPKAPAADAGTADAARAAR